MCSIIFEPLDVKRTNNSEEDVVIKYEREQVNYIERKMKLYIAEKRKQEELERKKRFLKQKKRRPEVHVDTLAKQFEVTLIAALSTYLFLVYKKCLNFYFKKCP